MHQIKQVLSQIFVLVFWVFPHAAVAELKLKPNLSRKHWLGCTAVYILSIGIGCLAEGAHAAGSERKGIKVGKMLQERRSTRQRQARCIELSAVRCVQGTAHLQSSLSVFQNLQTGGYYQKY